MQIDEWRAAAMACLNGQTRGSDEIDDRLERSLAELHFLMCDVPIVVDEAYKAIPESQLEREASRRAYDILKVDSARSRLPQRDTSIDELVAVVGVEARGVDAALWSLRDLGRPADPNVAYLVDDGTSAFVIPRERDPIPLRERGDGKPFTRRGIRFHRIIPEEIGGAKVRLFDAPSTWFGSRTQPTVLGAAMFANVVLQVEKSSNGNRYRVVGHQNQMEVAEEFASQLKHLHDAGESNVGCFSAVWPELTVTPEMLNQLATLLGNRGLSDDPGRPPGFLVPGSWHTEFQGKLYNIAPVLDGQGNRLFAYRKMRRFPLGGSTEAIEPGTELPILLYGDRLIAFAICRDFCELAGESPYEELGVDLVVVPSYGNGNTWKSHVQAAKKMRVIHDARTFMVQQAWPRRKGGGGWVIAAPIDLDKATFAACAQTNPWQRYEIDATTASPKVS